MFARIVVVLSLALLAVAVVARGSESARPEAVYVVQAGDTLWSIAAERYGGDPREGVWELVHRNGLASAAVSVGQRLLVPALPGEQRAHGP